MQKLHVGYWAMHERAKPPEVQLNAKIIPRIRSARTLHALEASEIDLREYDTLTDNKGLDLYKLLPGSPSTYGSSREESEMRYYNLMDS